MDLKKITEKVLKYWQQNNIESDSLEFDPKLEKLRNKPDYPLQFNFYDGPPFASGDPHYGHLLASTIKDLIPRYMYMRGYFVPRKWGWDCHGLPAEGYVEKLLKVKGKKEIEEKIGIEKFVEACRFSVMQVNENWKRFVSHLGRWIDMDRAYFTMDLDFMESVIWVFSKMYQDNFIYKSFKIQGYCPNCATPLSAYEISQGYADKQDKAITVKFRVKDTNQLTDVVAAVIKKDNKYLMLYHPECNQWFLPGGKVEKGEDLNQALQRELQEELGVDSKIGQYLGAFKQIHNSKFYKIHYFEAELIGESQIQEKDKHSQLAWVEVIPSDNELGFVLKIDLGNGENLIIDDPDRIKKEFVDLYILEYVFPKLNHNQSENQSQTIDIKELGIAPVYFLAWTTTPWTLPSNMFLAVNPDIDYVLIFDKKSQEYYVLAKDLIKKYYKNSEDYIEIMTIKGRELIGLRYEPLFDYYFQAPDIPEKYKKEVFKVLLGDFVSTESGTGIVHIAPAFGEDDWRVVTQSQTIGKSITYNEGKEVDEGPSYEQCQLPTESSTNLSSENNLFRPENANEWLFLPLNEYAEYTELVPDYKSMQVFQANEKIIQDVKNKNLVVKVESITHSYPHCRRCDTPLIYRAIDSWFVAVNKCGLKDDSKALNNNESLVNEDNGITDNLNNITDNKESFDASHQCFKDKLLKEAEEIYFVPESVKNRFKKGIEQAPDWNISRNRYWGAPLPVWEMDNHSQSENQSQILKEKINNVGLKYSIYDEKFSRIIVGSLDDLYKLSKTGSKNLARLVLQRHGETDFNTKHWADSRGDAVLTENGWKQAESLAGKYFDKFGADLRSGDYVIVISPLQRTFQTISLVVKRIISDNLSKIDFEDLKARYYQVVQLYQYLWDNYVDELRQILQGKKTLQDINDNQVKKIIEELEKSGVEIVSSVIFKLFSSLPLYVDWRITDHITPSIEGKEFHCESIQFNDQPIAGDSHGESALDVYYRVVESTKYWTYSNMSKTVIMVSHGDPIVMIRKALRNFDRKTRKYDFYPSKGQFFVHYIREKLLNEDQVIDFVKQVFSQLVEEEKVKGNDLQIDFSKLYNSPIKESDLHRPYIDEIWFEIDGVKFKRIPEILDCWYESGSMPYGQDHYPFEY